MAFGDLDVFLSAIGDVAKARGMARIAEESGLGRESLYKALRPGANPGFGTIQRVMAALGVALTAVPQTPEKAPEQPLK